MQNVHWKNPLKPETDLKYLDGSFEIRELKNSRLSLFFDSYFEIYHINTQYISSINLSLWRHLENWEVFFCFYHFVLCFSFFVIMIIIIFTSSLIIINKCSRFSIPSSEFNEEWNIRAVDIMPCFEHKNHTTIAQFQDTAFFI